MIRKSQIKINSNNLTTGYLLFVVQNNAPNMSSEINKHVTTLISHTVATFFLLYEKKVLQQQNIERHDVKTWRLFFE